MPEYLDLAIKLGSLALLFKKCFDFENYPLGKNIWYPSFFWLPTTKVVKIRRCNFVGRYVKSSVLINHCLLIVHVQQTKLDRLPDIMWAVYISINNKIIKDESKC